MKIEAALVEPFLVANQSNYKLLANSARSDLLLQMFPNVWLDALG